MTEHPDPIMHNRRPIITLGAEGYANTLYATPQPDGGWLFDVDVPEFPYADPILGDELITRAPKNMDHYLPTSSLIEALYRWFCGTGWVRLFPIEIDPEFQQEVWRMWEEGIALLTERDRTWAMNYRYEWRQKCGLEESRET